MTFEIYAGLKGKLGGAQYQLTDEFESEEEALDYAQHIATCAFFAHMGTNDYKRWTGFQSEARLAYFENNPDGFPTEKEVDDIAEDLIEAERLKLIDYRVVKKDSLDNTNENSMNDDKDNVK